MGSSWSCCGGDTAKVQSQHEMRSFVVRGDASSQRITPRQKRDPRTNHPIPNQNFDISRDAMQGALRDVARYLRQRDRQVTLVAIGGAVNTLLLRTRDTTHDVDFFHASAGNSQISLLSAAGRYANDRAGQQLGGAWINNETTLLMPRQVQRRLTDAAEAQNEVVFQEPGLKVLAAPWDYAFATKLDRLANGRGRPRDIADAAAYLHRFSARRGGHQVPSRVIQAWKAEYSTRMREEHLRQVDEEHRRRYGRAGIAF